MGSGRGWLAGDWPSREGGVLSITAAAWTAGFHWWRFGNITETRTQNVSEYMLVLALCLVVLLTIFVAHAQKWRDFYFRSEI